MWIKNTRGHKDAMLTFALFSFAVVTLNIFLSTFGSISFRDNVITFQTLDSSVMAVYLGATFTAYVSRRWTDKRYEVSVSTPDNNVFMDGPYPQNPYQQNPYAQNQSRFQRSNASEHETLDSSINLPE